MLERCWDEAMLGWAMLGRCWDDARAMLGRCWDDTGTMLGRGDAEAMLGRCYGDALGDAGAVLRKLQPITIKLIKVVLDVRAS